MGGELPSQNLSEYSRDFLRLSGDRKACSFELLECTVHILKRRYETD